jgi:hypothetical protein
MVRSGGLFSWAPFWRLWVPAFLGREREWLNKAPKWGLRRKNEK